MELICPQIGIVFPPLSITFPYHYLLTGPSTTGGCNQLHGVGGGRSLACSRLNPDALTRVGPTEPQRSHARRLTQSASSPYCASHALNPDVHYLRCKPRRRARIFIIGDSEQVDTQWLGSLAGSMPLDADLKSSERDDWLYSKGRHSRRAPANAFLEP